MLADRSAEADEFYTDLVPAGTTAQEADVVRQALAGLVWGKQFYRYDVPLWLDGDEGEPPPPEQRKHGRNAGWRHFDAYDILSMPDPWEYPWFAAWDLAFQAVAVSHIAPAFAKYQLLLMCREWFMHPNGAIPAYEWSFDDVNPPVHAWAALEVFRIDGEQDYAFLERVVPEAAAELHLVGQPRWTPRGTTSSRAASSAWTTSAPSTGRTCRRECAWTRPTARPGWRSTR